MTMGFFDPFGSPKPGGGGGASEASDVSFDNSGTSLQATNLQDAIVELLQRTSTASVINVTLAANSWNTQNKTYVITNNNIKSTSDIYISLPYNSSDQNYNTTALTNLMAVGQQEGYIVLQAVGDIPTTDIQVLLTIYNKG